MQFRFTGVIATLIASLAVACAPGAERDAAKDSTSSTASNAPTSAGSSSEVKSRSGWTVGADAIGPIRVGMAANDARRILGLAPQTVQVAGCSYIAGAPASAAHAAVMLANDTIVRFDVRDSTIATGEGARVGDTEARVKSLYEGRISVQPHKYVEGGHYLVVTDPGRAADRIVFETDGKVVTQYRAGRIPEVMNVEGCG